jgi:hypothetical protein
VNTLKVYLISKAAILMKQDKLLGAVRIISDTIQDFIYKCQARQQPSYFSREGGKIGFVNMIAITLNFLAKSMQTELDKFFEHVLKKTDTVTKQAYAEARFKLTVDAFKILFDKTAEYACDSSGLKTFKGYRVLPIDGTTLDLEDTYSLRAYFGVDGGEYGCATARASVMCDVLNKGLILDACIDKLKVGERELAIHHIKRLKELQIDKPLLTFDRGYASAELIDELIRGNTPFLFRVQRSFNAQIDRMPLGDHIKDVTVKKRVFRLRILKFKLSTGEVETLITNLPETAITSADLKAIYNLRWGVETAYRIIKGALQIENFTGTSQLIVEQDFFATMFLKNMVAFAKIDSDEIVEQNQNPDNLYDKKTNENQLIGILKDKLVIALLDTRPRAQARKVNAIVAQAARRTVPIRPDRQFPRLCKHSKRFCSSAKTAL